MAEEIKEELEDDAQRGKFMTFRTGKEYFGINIYKQYWSEVSFFGWGQMFAEIERWGREMDCHYEILVSGLERAGAHKFYNALGFIEAKGFKKYL